MNSRKDVRAFSITSAMIDYKLVDLLYTAVLPLAERINKPQMEEFRIQDYKPTFRPKKRPKGLSKKPSKLKPFPGTETSGARPQAPDVILQCSSWSCFMHPPQHIGALNYQDTDFYMVLWTWGESSVHCVYLLLMMICEFILLSERTVTFRVWRATKWASTLHLKRRNPYVSSRKPSHSLQRIVRARHAPMFRLHLRNCIMKALFWCSSSFLGQKPLQKDIFLKKLAMHRGPRTLLPTIVETHLYKYVSPVCCEPSDLCELMASAATST